MKSTQQARADLDALMIKYRQPDFRGHIGPTPTLKTKATVDASRKAVRDQWAGERFQPYKKHRVPVALDATHCSVKKTETETAEPMRVATASKRVFNERKQEINPATARPLVAETLAWAGGAAPTQERRGRRSFPGKGGVTMQGEVERMTQQDLETLSYTDRNSLMRQISMTKPRFTTDTEAARRRRWDPMSQALDLTFPDSPAPQRRLSRRPQTTSECAARDGLKKKNGIRMVALMRPYTQRMYQ